MMKEKCIDNEIIYDGKIIRVERDQIELENGHKSYREVVFNSGGICVLAITSDNKFILVKQFRYPSKEELYEIAGGKVEANEEMLVAAQRELKEETGYVSDEISYLGYFYPTVAYASEVIHMALMTNCVYEEQCLDEGEFVEVILLEKDELLKLIYQNEIKDAKTIIAFMKFINNKG